MAPFRGVLDSGGAAPNWVAVSPQELPPHRIFLLAAAQCNHTAVEGAVFWDVKIKDEGRNL